MNTQINDSEDRIKKNNQEMIDLHKMSSAPRKSLSLNVLKRYMSEEELSKILEGYAEHKLTTGAWGHKDRSVSLSMPLNDKEMQMLVDYITDFSTSVMELETKHGLKKNGLRSKVQAYSARFIYQNREILGL